MKLQWFGWLESVGGFLKVCLVLGSAILMYVIAGKGWCSSLSVSQR